MYKQHQIQCGNTSHFHVALFPDREDSFFEQLNSCLKQYKGLISFFNLTKNDLIFVKIFTSDTLNQSELMKKHPLFLDHFSNCGFSIIEQPPLDGNKINFLLWFIKGNSYKKYRSGNVFYLETGKLTHVFQCFRIPSTNSNNLCLETISIFERHKKLLEKYNSSIKDNCLRTWIYIRDIDKEYSNVVEGRNIFFNKNGLTKESHFIASTGIEGKCESPLIDIGIDFYSIIGIEENQIKYLKSPDYINSTHEYGVAFERGTSITFSDSKLVFISGTASIDKHGNCIYFSDITKQLERIFLNINELLKSDDLTYKNIVQFIVYVRNLSDVDKVKSFLSHFLYEIPSVVVLGKVCRPEWLVEIECIAQK